MNATTRFTFDRKQADQARAEGRTVRMCEGTGDDGSDLPAWSIGPDPLDARLSAARAQLPAGFTLDVAWLIHPTPTATVEWVLTSPEGEHDYFLHEDDALAALRYFQ